VSLPPLLWIAITPDVARAAQVALMVTVDALAPDSPSRPRYAHALDALREAIETSVAEAGAAERANPLTQQQHGDFQ
jgi:hypothetical protein